MELTKKQFNNILDNAETTGTINYAIWQDHQIVGHIRTDSDTRNMINRIQNDFYIGFDTERK